MFSVYILDSWHDAHKSVPPLWTEHCVFFVVFVFLFCLIIYFCHIKGWLTVWAIFNLGRDKKKKVSKKHIFLLLLLLYTALVIFILLKMYIRIIITTRKMCKFILMYLHKDNIPNVRWNFNNKKFFLKRWFGFNSKLRD